MLLTTLMTTFALAQQGPLVLSADAELVGGATVTLTVSGVEPGQRLFLFVGDSGTHCPDADRVCLNLAAPELVRHKRVRQETVSWTVQVPESFEGRHVQVATRVGVSNVLDVAAEPSGPALAFTGVAAFCGVDTADLLVEYIGHAQSMVATAYLGGDALVSQEMTLLEASPGAIFFWAEASDVPVADCDEVTWVYEAFNATEHACIVQGPEELDLVGSDMLPSDCLPW